MNKLAQRLCIFLFGVPAVAALVLLLPHHNHLALNVVIVIFCALGAAEFSVMLSGRNMAIPATEAAVLGALLPAAAALIAVLGLGPFALPAAATVGAAWLLLSRAFSRGEGLDAFVGRFSAGLAVLLYPGLFLVWLVGMSRWDNAGIVIITFLVTVFSGDSVAWAAGMLFGKGNRGVVPASPNKSVAGFVGGAVGPVLVGMGAVALWPGAFVTGSGSPFGQPLVAGAVLGLLTGCAGALGDLAESALKRSAGAKDSGSFIPGRGGVLDSLDSVALAAPVFYACYTLFFRL